MNHFIQCRQLTLALSALMFLSIGGCTSEEAAAPIKQAEESAKEATDAVKEGVGDAVKKGEDMAADLGEKAMGFLSPIKEKLGDLDSLKDTPEKLKVAVQDLIKTIEDKTDAIKLPAGISDALESVKEKLIALKDYLEGKYEQAKIDEHIKDIEDSVKSGLGLSKK